MFSYLSRKDRNEQAIENFINSSATTLNLMLYSSEVKSLRKKYPQILITENAKSTNELYSCTVSKL